MLKIARWNVFAALAVILLLAAACGGGEKAAPTETAPAASAPALDLSKAGSVSGKITYANGDPDTEIKMSADPVCEGLHAEPVYTQTVEAAGGNLANVFVYVKEGLPAGQSFPTPADPALLDQKGCRYTPHVSGVMVNQKVIIRNSDPTLHNVHALPKVNSEFNQAQPFEGMEIEKKFDKPEVMVTFKCDVHPWMSSYMAVLTHPYFAVSGADGSFTIPQLPPGSYVLEAWHETLGSQTQSVTVGESQAVEVSFSFPAAG